ncbi:MAG: ATP-dependent helicase [Acidobacteria bacterium]|nr:ATP-dependent helicase [Acidobacteriota bacterium]
MEGSPRRYVLRKAPSAKTYRVDYNRELNEEQRSVVFAGDGPLLVIAGAGSGKTRTLVYRMSRLIEDGAEPASFCLLTFTNRAAKEMTRRVENLIGTDISKALAGTFHSVAARILRTNADLLGYRPNFSILDSEDAKDIMDSAISDLAIPVTEKRFPKADLLRDLLSLGVNTGRELREVIAAEAPHLMPQMKAISDVVARFRQRKKSANAMDYDDLLVLWAVLLKEHPSVRKARAIRIRELLVDEFQDINHLQSEIVDLLVLDSATKNVLAVGDDAQSIYSFRGADVEALLGFPKRYPTARICRLETNYRSTPQILSLANASIRHNKRRFEKELRAVRTEGVPVAVVGTADTAQQSEFVAQRVLELRDENIPLASISVLYRAHYQALELQLELTRRGIPYEVRSGLRFFEQQHVKDVLAFLRIVVNPRDEISFKRAFKLRPRVGERLASTVWLVIADAPDPASALSAIDPAKLPAAARPHFRSFQKTLATIRKDSFQSAPAESIRWVLEEGGYAEIARSKFTNATARLDELEALAQFALGYDDVSRFLQEVTLLGDPAGEDRVTAERDDERLVLSSVHQAKGLEWSAVFVIGLVEDRFPNARAAKDEAGLEEERRLFHVAVTRARDELTLVHPLAVYDRTGILVMTEPSRFLRELPADLYERWVLETGPAVPADPSENVDPDERVH